MKVSLVEKEEVSEYKDFERQSKFKPLFIRMAETGKVLVVEEEDLEELKKYQRTLHTMSRRYIPKDLKLQTRMTPDGSLIARLTEKKFEPKTLGELLNIARTKVIDDLVSKQWIARGREADVAQYLRDSLQ
ncbi:MAG TPA: hypothetical protein ENI27_07675 [bacterium]|nr:hypothetical protein [bacterium]